MRKLSKYLAHKISTAFDYDSEREKVIEYGLLALTQMVVIAFCSFVIGIIFGFWAETLFVYFGVGLLRRVTGGVHSNSLLGCTVTSIIIICTLSAISRYLLIHIEGIYFWCIQALVFIICFIIIYIKAPMDTPNKPIKKPEKIKKLRLKSLMTCSLWCIISSVLFIYSKNNILFISFSYSLICALIWQTFTLTKIGTVIVHFFDRVFINQNV